MGSERSGPMSFFFLPLVGSGPFVRFEKRFDRRFGCGPRGRVSFFVRLLSQIVQRTGHASVKVRPTERFPNRCGIERLVRDQTVRCVFHRNVGNPFEIETSQPPPRFRCILFAIRVNVHDGSRRRSRSRPFAFEDECAHESEIGIFVDRGNDHLDPSAQGIARIRDGDANVSVPVPRGSGYRLVDHSFAMGYVHKRKRAFLYMEARAKNAPRCHLRWLVALTLIRFDRRPR